MADAIEARGVGFAQVKELGTRLAVGSNPGTIWFKAMDSATDIHGKRAVERAFSEWADGDSIASHVAYGIDVFCTDDLGKSNAEVSILDKTNKRWLTATYNVQFKSIEELSATI